jgi:hypothetical protein
MEDEKRLFYEKLDEYESKLPQKYDREGQTRIPICPRMIPNSPGFGFAL